MTESTQPAAVPLTLRYAQPSDYHADHLQLFAQLQRAPVAFAGRVRQPLLFREAMATLFGVVSSDFRYVPKDRSQYAAFMQMRRSHQHSGLFRAHQAYYRWLAQNDPTACCVLDPVITVHPDRMLFEVFSKDEGAYAQLAFDQALFESAGEAVYGVTHIDFSDNLLQGIEQIRSRRSLSLSVGQQAVRLQSAADDQQPAAEVLEKAVQVPQSWLRGLLQVQTAAHLTADRFHLNPIDLYNVLHHLRMHADRKGKRRGLRVELVPGQMPNLVLEPDERLVPTTAAPYGGRQAKVLRLWGRRRLALLKRFLPYTEQIEVALLGNGMPSFWTLRGQGVCLTLAITGFTTGNWSQALNFDLLLPRRADSPAELDIVLQHLSRRHVAALDTLTSASGLGRDAVFSALQQACQQGLVMYDSSTAQYRYRPLTEQPLDAAQFQFRHLEEKLAFDLVTRQNALSGLNMTILPGEGVELSATVQVREDQREYLPRLKINEEGQVAKAECSCHAILQHGLAHGPCRHLIALRIAYAHALASRDPNLITQETCALMRRKPGRQETIQIALNDRRLQLIWEDLASPRVQRFAYNSVAEARAAYLSQIRKLEYAGFVVANV